MSYRVRVSPRAARQIAEAADWWFENRQGAPFLFSEEIERGLHALQNFPRAGQAVSHPQIAELRRILLSPVRYHLYYVVSDDFETVEILELWHTSREEPKA